MFRINDGDKKYIQDKYTLAEGLYNEYLKMREYVSAFENIKYAEEDNFKNSKEGKEGFIAAVYIMLSLIADM